jgi:hypothetical protein
VLGSRYFAGKEVIAQRSWDALTPVYLLLALTSEGGKETHEEL